MSAVRVYEVMLTIEKTPEGEERGVITLPDEAAQTLGWNEDTETPITIDNISKQIAVGKE